MRNILALVIGLNVCAACFFGYQALEPILVDASRVLTVGLACLAGLAVWAANQSQPQGQLLRRRDSQASQTRLRPLFSKSDFSKADPIRTTG